MKHRTRHIVIVGGGPAGSTLATLLARQGHGVTMFDDGRRPDLIVGESLIPSIIPVLRRLGIEEQVAEIGVFKPGVSFVFGEAETIDFTFRAVSKCDLPPYAYNVPRPAFDRLIEQCAEQSGARRIAARAKLTPHDGRLLLEAESLAQAPWLDGKQPDLLVDATGRTRLFARLLDIPAEVGPRRDVAYFAHYEGFEPNEPAGQIAIGRLHTGWSWSIPLRDCMSCGVVLDKEEAARLGDTPEQRIEAAIDRDPVLSRTGARRRRVSDVAVYTNYQLVSTRGFGPGWTMVGDAFGFVDPMLSPGMWLALHSAELLAANLDDLPAYDRAVRREICAWMEFIRYYYDGRMFAMYHTGMDWMRRYNMGFSRAAHRFFEAQVACMACGATTSSSFSRKIVGTMLDIGARCYDPARVAIR